MNAGTPQLIEAELIATLVLFDTFATEISTYILQRKEDSLVNALLTYIPIGGVHQDTVNFIVSKVNVQYYTL